MVIEGQRLWGGEGQSRSGWGAELPSLSPHQDLGAPATAPARRSGAEVRALRSGRLALRRPTLQSESHSPDSLGTSAPGPAGLRQPPPPAGPLIIAPPAPAGSLGPDPGQAIPRSSPQTAMGWPAAQRALRALAGGEIVPAAPGRIPGGNFEQSALDLFDSGRLVSAPRPGASLSGV